MNVDKKCPITNQGLSFSKNIDKDQISKIIVLIRQFTQDKHLKHI